MFSRSKTSRGGRGDGGGGRGTGRVWCRVCGRPVGSVLGEVCSRPSCHDRYLARFGR